MGTEYELKFQASPGVLTAIREAFSGAEEAITMETTYFDTPSGSLSSRRYTLRRRLENGVSVCTLKTPGGNVRGEWETECQAIETAIEPLVAMGAPEDLAQLAQEGLIPICGARFTRIAKTVTLPEGTVELALDQGILMGGNRQEPLCEAEVELKSGPMELCDRFAEALAARFALVPESKSKFARALALYKGD